ncbi:hypothetical protein TKK_0006214 [Trichogramma kaykai]|uniref:Uncharacterized protein n=1 Tax=Trichogramma kaykai TaxID=54128 RepID=A0ABD2XEJ1_9HYME
MSRVEARGNCQPTTITTNAPTYVLRHPITTITINRHRQLPISSKIELQQLYETVKASQRATVNDRCFCSCSLGQQQQQQQQPQVKCKFCRPSVAQQHPAASQQRYPVVLNPRIYPHLHQQFTHAPRTPQIC